ncbi:hypothetical protein HEP87_42995 [Streptomyces sp. S1D4-11]|nr:hypothetical protein [Streptomyces sp. S1D4-11]QIY99450.1 hypothetical protein HEP87_42995 [Streptomyces sp. S1D4-11]
MAVYRDGPVRDTRLVLGERYGRDSQEAAARKALGAGNIPVADCTCANERVVPVKARCGEDGPAVQGFREEGIHPGRRVGPGGGMDYGARDADGGESPAAPQERHTERLPLLASLGYVWCCK